MYLAIKVLISALIIVAVATAVVMQRFDIEI